MRRCPVGVVRKRCAPNYLWRTLERVVNKVVCESLGTATDKTMVQANRQDSDQNADSKKPRSGEIRFGAFVTYF